MRVATDDLVPEQRQVLLDIAEAGVHIAHVEETRDAPGWSYTVGMLASFGQPEVLVIGLPDGVAAELLDVVADEADRGHQFAAGQLLDGLVHGYPVRFAAITDRQARQWLPLVPWAYGRGEVPCLQLVYPDKQGRWPWQADVRDGFRAVQPILERSAEAGGRGDSVTAP